MIFQKPEMKIGSLAIGIK